MDTKNTKEKLEQVNGYDKKTFTSDTSAFDNLSKALNNAYKEISKALIPTIEAVSDALAVVFNSFDMLTILKAELARTPRYRLIRRYKLRRAIKNIERSRAENERG